jgi:hypothetical protein
MSSLKPFEELTVLNWPLESMTTGMASLLPVVTPRTPAAKKEVWIPGVPIRMVLLSVDAPWLAM